MQAASPASQHELQKAGGNLTSRLLKADKTILPSDTKQSKAFLNQFINSSAGSSKTAEEQFDSEPSELVNLIRNLQPQSTKNSFRAASSTDKSFKLFS